MRRYADAFMQILETSKSLQELCTSPPLPSRSGGKEAPHLAPTAAESHAAAGRAIEPCVNRGPDSVCTFQVYHSILSKLCGASQSLG